MNGAAIEVRGLVKRFGELEAVAGLDLTVPTGQCLGLLGPNGAGKTTTVEILEGLQSPSSGEVRLLGLGWREAPENLRGRIGIALQETRFYDRLSVEETLRLFRSFYARGPTVDELIARVQLEEKRHVHVNKLSGGQKQRLALGVALAGDPELLFLDEPTTGLDPQSRRALWDVVASLKQRGCTVVLTTHYMEEAAQLCDRVVIIDRGRVVADGTPPALIARVGATQLVELATSPALEPETFRSLVGVQSVRALDGGLQLAVDSLHQTLPLILDTVRTRGAALERLSTRAGTLDDVFLALTGRHLREEGA